MLWCRGAMLTRDFVAWKHATHARPQAERAPGQRRGGSDRTPARHTGPAGARLTAGARTLAVLAPVRWQGQGLGTPGD